MNQRERETNKEIHESLDRIEKSIDKTAKFTRELQDVCTRAKAYLLATKNVFMATDKGKEETCRAKLWEAIEKVEKK